MVQTVGFIRRARRVASQQINFCVESALLQKVTRHMRSLTADLAQRARPATIAGVLWRGQSYLNLLYLLAAFPLGLVYFILLITLLSAGFSTVLVLIGIPLLLATLY